MSKPKILFKPAKGFEDLLPVGFLPRRETEKSAGYDIRALVWTPNTSDILNQPMIEIPPGESAIIHTGLTIELPNDLFMDIRPRSGLAFNLGITLRNSPATIDADYAPNEIKIALENRGKDVFTVRNGMRIAQGVILRYYTTYDDKPSNDQRIGGLGSTGL